MANETHPAPVTGQQSMPLTLGSDTDENAAKLAFAAVVSPCLALVAPVGMGEDERRTWLRAAYMALKHLPPDLLRDGAQDAMQQADHPSKIVATIIKSVHERYKSRREAEHRKFETQQMIAAQIEANRAYALPAPVSPETTKEILDRVWPTRRQHEPGFIEGALGLDPDRECRTPSPADYERLFGVKLEQQ